MADNFMNDISRSLKETATKEGGKTALARAQEITAHVNRVMGEIMDKEYAKEMSPPENHDVVGVVPEGERGVENG
jgi:hypothetical protein